MNFSGFLSKATESIKTLEQDFTKELGLRGVKEQNDEGGWQQWAHGDDDEWVDIDTGEVHARVKPEDEPEQDKYGAPVPQAQFEAAATEELPPLSGAEAPVPPMPEKAPEEATLETDQMPDARPFEEASDGEEWDAAEGTDQEWQEPDGSADGPPHVPDEDTGLQPPEVEKSEEVNALQKRIHELELAAQTTSKTLEASETKIRVLTKECESLRRSRDNRASDAMLLKEKDNQIKVVMDEGEQLARKIAEREQQLRKAIADRDGANREKSDVERRLSTSEAKNESLTAKLHKLEVSERGLKEARDVAERRLRELGNESRTRAGTQAALDATRAELESLRSHQARQLEEQDHSIRAEAQEKIEAYAAQVRSREEALNRQIAELRAHVAHLNDSTGWREDSLRKELEKARSRCEAVEGENQDLTAAVSDATRPLVRQIESLQAQLSEKNSVMESVESSQIERVREAENACAAALQKQEQAESRVTTIQGKIRALEEQMRVIKAERNDIAAELVDVRAQASEREAQLEKEVEELKTDSLRLQHQLGTVNATLADERSAQVERVNAYDEREEDLRKKLVEHEHMVRELRLELREEKNKAVAASRHRARSPSPTRSLDEIPNDEIPDLNDDIVGKDQLKTNLRLHKDKVIRLQKRLAAKEEAVRQIAEDVVKLTVQLDEARAELGDAPKIRKELEDLRKRQDTLMVLYGEREERVQELEQDLADVNSMYKEQINDLLLQMERLHQQIS